MGAERVLLAAPEEPLLRSYGDFLTRDGFEVATARDGLDCVAKLRGFRPAVLVLDPALPWGWGDGVLARMREEADIPTVPVILLFTRPSPEGLGDRLAGFPSARHLATPPVPDLLAAMIRRLLDAPAAAAVPWSGAAGPGPGEV